MDDDCRPCAGEREGGGGGDDDDEDDVWTASAVGGEGPEKAGNRKRKAMDGGDSSRVALPFPATTAYLYPELSQAPTTAKHSHTRKCRLPPFAARIIPFRGPSHVHSRRPGLAPPSLPPPNASAPFSSAHAVCSLIQRDTFITQALRYITISTGHGGAALFSKRGIKALDPRCPSSEQPAASPRAALAPQRICVLVVAVTAVLSLVSSLSTSHHAPRCVDALVICRSARFPQRVHKPRVPAQSQMRSRQGGRGTMGGRGAPLGSTAASRLRCLSPQSASRHSPPLASYRHTGSSCRLSLANCCSATRNLRGLRSGKKPWLDARA
ncbi:hypothetical protein BV25DRAFT_1652201 [Artomyces pyxidatus]|uniref:Uncharacterized protein n=1 Tax=Artomyces pyxidatus TaxID=48021 RepID=A0ACB8SIQ7_9AGAM|nr:hypothetical protein BV25DRAFT_1652201 [Artomyces pyxidatus]